MANANDYLTWISAAALLCCCCLGILAAAAGAVYWLRPRRPPIPAAQAVVNAVPTAAETVVVRPPAAPAGVTVVARPPVQPASPPPPAGPIEPDDIRAKLLGLNGPDKPYVVQATGYKIAIAPAEVTGYLLEIAFNYAEKAARFVETGSAHDARLKQDARQLLEAEGWTVRG